MGRFTDDAILTYLQDRLRAQQGQRDWQVKNLDDLDAEIEKLTRHIEQRQVELRDGKVAS